MTDRFSQLPWEDLRRMDGDLPWSALETFAEAVVAEPELAQELFAEYDRAWRAVDVPTYIDLYVPAIFTLAAPRLSNEQRREIGGFLVDKLIEAGIEEAEVAEECLVKAAGAMGPAILPKVLDTLDSMPEGTKDAVAWSMCWSLTALAAKTDDAAIRDRTIQTCLRLLEQIERDEYEEFLGISAAWTLALLKHMDAAPLLERLSKKVAPIDGGADFREALRFLQGQSAHPYTEAWEVPVREWLPSAWESGRKWYAQQGPGDSEEQEEAAVSKRQDELVDGFLASPHAAKLSEAVAEDAPYITHALLEYAYTYEGATPEELTKSTMKALLFDVLPRKISAEQDFFEKVPVVAESLLRWLASEGILPEGESTADAVREWAEESVAAATDSRNWGPAKQFTMQAQRAGVDATDEKALRRYMLEQTQATLAKHACEAPPSAPVTPPIPIVEHAPKVGRNDPCPCGSGKKYKKCHGAAK